MTVTIDMDPAADAEPIRGVDLDRYARLSAEMLQAGLTRPEAIEEFVEANGITPDDWQAIQAGWVERLSRSEELRLRYHDAATAYLPAAGSRSTERGPTAGPPDGTDDPPPTGSGG